MPSARMRRPVPNTTSGFKNSMTLQIELDETASRILKDGSVVPASIYHETMVVEPGDAMIYMFK